MTKENHCCYIIAQDIKYFMLLLIGGRIASYIYCSLFWKMGSRVPEDTKILERHQAFLLLLDYCKRTHRLSHCLVFLFFLSYLIDFILCHYCLQWFICRPSIILKQVFLFRASLTLLFTKCVQKLFYVIE